MSAYIGPTGAVGSGAPSGAPPARLFAAIVPPPGALTPLEQVVAGLRDADPAVRWIARGQWHVTLVFMGAVGPSSIGPLTDALRATAAAHTGPLTLRVSGAGAFPRARTARVLWAGLSGDLHALTTLAEACRAAATRAGAGCADGPFRPHLTVARIRGRADVRALASALATVRAEPWDAREVVLFRSRLGAEGGRARHEVLARLPLGPPRAG